MNGSPFKTRSALQEYLRNYLSQNSVTVTFEKADGEIRIMQCTTDLNQVPPSKWPDKKLTEQLADKSSTTYRVFDVAKQDWRSFKLESIISLSIDGIAYEVI